MHRPSWGVTIRSLGVHDLLYFDPAFAMWVVERSLRGRWSKVWVHGDGKPFQGADRNEFRPKRWVENSPLSHWLAAPIPEAPAIDIKGSWIDVVTGELRQDPNKEERDYELFQKGGA
jgi:hypothetical protein